MDETKLISVIVPVYKVEPYICRCVDSILAQTYRNLEIILVDDGSPDTCGSICDEYARRDSRIRVIHKPNGGLSDARNAGIEIAQGDYLAFADSDDWVEPDAYGTMLEAAQKHNAILVCAGRFDEDGVTGINTEGQCPAALEVIPAKELVRRIFLWDRVDSAAWDKLYARHLFREIRYPVGRNVEDVPTTYRIAFLAGSALMLPKRIYHYVHRENSITTAALSDKTFHFSRNAAGVYADIREHYPFLEREARYLLIRSLYYNLWMEERASAESREQFRDIFDENRRELRRHLGFILTSPLFSKVEKVEDTLLALNLYHAFRSLYHRRKKDAS